MGLLGGSRPSNCATGTVASSKAAGLALAKGISGPGYHPSIHSTKPTTLMQPENTLDWIAFILLIIGALSWAYFVTDTNILDLLLEKIWDPLDDVLFLLIGLSGLYWIGRVVTHSST